VLSLYLAFSLSNHCDFGSLLDVMSSILETRREPVSRKRNCVHRRMRTTRMRRQIGDLHINCQPASRALWCSALSVRVPGCQKLQMTA